MAPTIKSVTTGTDSGGTASVSVTVPSSTADGDVVIAIHCNDFRDYTNMVAPVLSGFAPTMNFLGGADGGSLLSHIKVWGYQTPVGAGGATQTLVCTETGTHDGDKGLSVYVLSGADAVAFLDGTLVATSSPSTSAGSFVLAAVSPSNTDSLLFAHTRTSNGAGTASITQPGSMTEQYDVANFTRFEGATEQLSASGSTGTRTFTPATSVPYVAVMFAIKAAAAATTIPYNPQRATLARDYGKTQWSQRDRRDANTVASAVNTLPSPLDVAYGAGGAIWQQRGGAADAAARTWQVQQRTYLDPSQLSPAVAMPAPPPTRTVPTRDSGEAQWLQRIAWGQITTALLENELLGGAETITRVASPVTNAPRWWMPQQPQREAFAPGLLDSAELEDALLGGDVRRHGHPAIYTDRREMPQQRAYISDPSFYPTTAPTDPLAIAWGAGGTYALLYTTAALQVDRRNVPQQRRYISDPSVLATALLEGVLLGGADLARHAFFITDRRTVPQQPARVDFAGSYLADPLFLDGGRWWRVSIAATHADRRETVAQRITLLFVGGAAPPVLKASSTSTVTAGRTSTAAVTARRTSTDAVTAKRTSSGGIG